jgi:hypothetical protein
VSSFFNNLGRSRVADYDTRRGFSPSTRVATPSRFSLPRDFGVEDLSQYAEEDLPGAIYRDEEDPFAPTASNTTSARVTPWNLIFPTRTESPLPRTPSPIVRTSLPESYERTRLASPASTSSLDALAQAAAVAPRSVTPELQYPDPLEVTQPQEEEVPSENTFGPLSRSASPSYHVRTPSPQSPLSRTPSPLAISPPPGPPPSFVQAVSPSTPPSDQENIRPPLAELTETPLDPYLPPACLQNPSPIHPHQYYLLELNGQQVWRPISEGQVASFLDLPSHAALLENPTIFPTVTPFKGYSPHAGVVSPTDQFQAAVFDIPALYLCSRVGYAAPATDTPLGYLVYTFRPSIRTTFAKYSQLVCNVFEGALVIGDVYDFLDGRRIYIYGKLRFDNNSVYLSDQTLHFEDAVARHPYLLRHCITPRLPADPCSFISIFPDASPL